MHSTRTLFLLACIISVVLSTSGDNEYDVNINIDRETFKKLEKSVDFFNTVHSHSLPGGNVTANLRLDETQVRILRDAGVTIESSILIQHVKRNEMEFRKRGVKPTDDPTPTSYHTNQQMHDFLMDLVNEYPNITRVHSIGKSVNNVSLEVITIHDFNNRRRQDTLIPQFKYVANMHGDETVGRELMLSFALLLCQGFANGDAEIVDLVQNVEISILPSMNPDGFAVPQRRNANGVDLNRNFDDQYKNRTNTPQPEMLAIVNWANENRFVLSANFHGGSVVASYGYDGVPSGSTADTDTPNYTPDQNTFLWLSRTYASANPPMHNSSEFNEGVTNGAEWYPLYGGMQDWVYLNRDCFEITIELSYTKNPGAANLASYWNDNKLSIMNYLKKVQTGIRGRVVDSAGNPLEGTVVVQGISKNIRIENGTYFRMLSPGDYTIEFHVDGYNTTIREVTTFEDKPVVLDLLIGGTTESTSSTSSINSNNSIESAAFATTQVSGASSVRLFELLSFVAFVVMILQ